MGERLFCYKVTDKLSELCSCLRVLWNVELVSNEIRYLAEAISKQSVEGRVWLLLNADCKIKKRKMA